VTLVRQGGISVVPTHLHTGAPIQEHAAPGAVTAQVLDGHVRAQVRGDTLDLKSDRLLAFDSGVRHSVKAAGGPADDVARPVRAAARCAQQGTVRATQAVNAYVLTCRQGHRVLMGWSGVMMMSGGDPTLIQVVPVRTVAGEERLVPPRLWSPAAAMAVSLALAATAGITPSVIPALEAGIPRDRWSATVQAHGELQLWGWFAVSRRRNSGGYLVAISDSSLGDQIATV